FELLGGPGGVKGQEKENGGRPISGRPPLGRRENTWSELNFERQLHGARRRDPVDATAAAYRPGNEPEVAVGVRRLRVAEPGRIRQVGGLRPKLHPPALRDVDPARKARVDAEQPRTGKHGAAQRAEYVRV